MVRLPAQSRLGALLLWFAAAANCSTATSNRSPVAANSADTLVAGCSGGVTGGGGGVAVTGAGELLSWSRPGPAPGPTEWKVVGRDQTAAQRLFPRLAAAKFDQTDFNDPSNMTCYLARQGGSKSHEVAWPMGQRPPRIAAIVALYDDVRKAVAKP